jgi:hypothetical protein
MTTDNRIFSRNFAVYGHMHARVVTGLEFSDRSGPAGLEFSTGPVRPVTGRF